MDMIRREEKCRRLIRKYYAGVPSREKLMDEVVISLLRPQSFLLDAGCGETAALLKRYGQTASLAVGMDVVAPADPEVRPLLFARGDLREIPFQDKVFDVIVSRSVVEHLETPKEAFSELARILKPGGKIILTTPNKYYYSSVIARSIPFHWKDYFLNRVFGEESYDHFPVFYRANTRRAFYQIAKASGLRVTRILAIRHFPYYLMFSPALFRLGMLYD